MIKPNPIFYLTLISLFATNIYAANRKNPQDLIIGKDFKHDISHPLRDLQARTDIFKHKYNIMPIQRTIFGEKSSQSEMTSPRPIPPVPVDANTGMGQSMPQYHVTQPQPDVNLAVGSTQYMQYANPDIAIFDKSGKVVPNFPKPSTSIWAGFGGVCENFADGRVSLKYDELANRWVMSQLASQNQINGPFFICTAVSTSDNATGSYYRYAFPLNTKSTLINLAVWPDAYYLGLNMVGGNTGTSMCALERDKMLSGFPASIVCKQLDQASPLTPASLLGSALLPPVGTPAYFFGLNPPNSITVYKFFTDFDNPPNTTISSIEIPVRPYQPACLLTQGLVCVEQPNTSNKLDLVSDKFLAAVSYREFPEGYGSIVATHSIDGPIPPGNHLPKKPSPALRWYEFRVSDSTQTRNPILYQQTTLAPDTKNRFAGSISIDAVGNISLAYTVSSSKVHPSPEMAWRAATDPINAMTIQPLLTGTGSQINNDSAWTENTKLIADPFNICTMFFTGEYLKTDGSFNWNTSVIKFVLPCPSGSPAYKLRS